MNNDTEIFGIHNFKDICQRKYRIHYNPMDCSMAFIEKVPTHIIHIRNRG